MDVTSVRIIEANEYSPLARQEQQSQYLHVKFDLCNCENGICGENCINRLLSVECDDRNCRWGLGCGNRTIQLRDFPQVELYKTSSMGTGVRAKNNIAPGTIISDYLGEVLVSSEMSQRVFIRAFLQDFSTYCMIGSYNLYIDARYAGTVARWINHSCVPNCRAIKWSICTEERVVIVALTAISSGEPLTLNYRLSRVVQDNAEQCLCSSGLACLGYITGSTNSLARDFSNDNTKCLPLEVDSDAEGSSSSSDVKYIGTFSSKKCSETTDILNLGDVVSPYSDKDMSSAVSRESDGECLSSSDEF